MNPKDPVDQIRRFHDCYRKVSGWDVGALKAICDPREHLWSAFIRQGFTIDDLDFVIVHLNRQIKAGERNPGSLRLSTLIEPIHFGEELGRAKAEARNSKPGPTPKERVVQAFSPKVTELPAPMTARPVSELIAELKRSVGMSP